MISNKLAFFILLIVTAIAKGQPGASDVGIISAVKDASVELIGLPMPGQLENGWWKYFNVESQHLQQRISEAKRQYPVLIESLEKSRQASARQYFDQLISNLSVIHAARKTPGNIAKKLHQPEKEYYSINDWLEINEKLRNEKSDYADNLIDFENRTAALQAAQNRLSNLLLEYAETDPKEPDKITLGFQLLAVKSAVELNSEQLKQKKAELDGQQLYLIEFRKLSKTAAAKLRSDMEFSGQADLLIKEHRNQLQVKQKKLNQMLLASMDALDNNPIARSMTRLRDQNIIVLKLEQEILNVNIAILEVQQVLSQVLLDLHQGKFNHFYERLQQWQELIVNGRKVADLLSKDTSRELMRIQEQMLNQTVTSGNEPEIEKLFGERLLAVQMSHIKLKKLEIELEKLDLLNNLLDDQILQRSGKFVHIFNWSTSTAENFVDDLTEWSGDPLFNIGDTPVTPAGLIRAMMIISIAILISFLFRRGMSRVAERLDANGKGVSVFYTVGRLAHYLILLLGIIIALSSIGLDFTSLALVAGALSVGIGFGLQSVVNNFVSGLILLFEGTIKVGDFIELDSGVMGLVKEINVRNTQINTNDNVDIIVPNSVLVSDKVINWTLNEANRRIRVPFGVAYGSDKELVKKAALDAANRVRYTHIPKHAVAAQCWLVNFGDSSLDFELVVWINQEAVKKPALVHAAYLWEIESCLRENGVEIPFPQRDLHLRSVFGRKEFKQ